MFDQKTIMALGYYVYMLKDPRDDKPFYVGKGCGNRVFQHVDDALNNPHVNTDKFDKIREIDASGNVVQHLIVYHGLQTAREAFQIECVLIDTLNNLGYNLTNAVVGHDANQKGIMTTDEIKRLYNATPLTSMGTDCVIININGQYNRSMGGNAIYQATKGCWRMNANRIKNVKYVLSEYRGLIVEVFEVERWYTMPRQYVSGKNKGKTYNGWCFDGHVAPDVIRDLYINKSIAHTKTKGQANPITYSLP